MVVLPHEGKVTVGRRPGNSVLCKDLAVSGQHCIFHCSGNSAPHVEDCSTNGCYLNDVKITKGEPHQLTNEDVVSLTKPPEDPSTADGPTRVQFRLEFREHVPEDAGDAPAKRPRLSTDVPPTAPDVRAGDLVGAGAGAGDNCFAQELLKAEQQSKAVITTQLLQSQSKLEEERQKADAASRELEKIRKQVAEERARRQEAEESRDRLVAEAKSLRKEGEQLQELRSLHEELRQRHEVVKSDLQTRQLKCAQLEGAQEQLRKDLEKLNDSHHKASQQHAELQTRARHAQERATSLEQQYVEAKQQADWAQTEGARIEAELTTERKAREELEVRVANTREQVSQAEASERAAREALDAATAKRAELECQASSANSDFEGARAAARQAQQRLSASKQLVERLQEAGQGLSAELKRRAEVWEKACGDGNFEGLEEALASGGPTFAQVTCQMESPPSKVQHQGEGGEATTSKHMNSTAASDAAPSSEDRKASQPPVRPDEALPAEPVPALEVAPSAALVDAAPASILPPAEPLGAKPVEEVPSDDDELLAAASRDQHAGGAAAASAVTSASTGPERAMPGCSTAWSLEVLEGTAPGGEAAPPAKRLKANGD